MEQHSVLTPAEVYRAGILSTIADYTHLDKAFTAKGYAPAMDSYREQCRHIFAGLEEACQTGELTVDSATEYFLEQLQKRWQEAGRSGKTLMEQDKVRLALFLVPMIRTLELSCGEEFCQVLQEKWVGRYPKSPFTVGSYEDILGGFNQTFLGFRLFGRKADR